MLAQHHLSDKLQKLQNRAFRIITREYYETRTADVLNKVGLPDLKSRREYQLAVYCSKSNTRRYQRPTMFIIGCCTRKMASKSESQH